MVIRTDLGCHHAQDVGHAGQPNSLIRLRFHQPKPDKSQPVSLFFFF